MSRKRGGGAKDPAQYECFFELKQLCTQECDWFSWFDNASQGILPKGFKFANGKLTYTQKRKSVNVVLSPDPRIALEECKTFIKKTGMRTFADRKAEKDKCDKNNKKGWSGVKKDEDKSMYARRYILAQKGLTQEELRSLRHKVFLSLLKSTLTTNRVVFENGYIVSIAL